MSDNFFLSSILGIFAIYFFKIFTYFAINYDLCHHNNTFRKKNCRTFTAVGHLGTIQCAFLYKMVFIFQSMTDFTFRLSNGVFIGLVHRSV